MEISEEKVDAIQNILNMVIDVGTECAKIIVKNNITEEDINSLKTMIKEKPEDYFPNLNK